MILRVIKRLHDRVWKAITRWLADEHAPAEDAHLSDYERLRYEIRSADVILVEGRSRVSEIIKTITLSSWTHSALFIGRLHDIRDKNLRDYISYHYDGDPGEPLLIEALLGEGTIVAPLSKYKGFHLRICRPKGLSPSDAEQVIKKCVGYIGLDYDLRQLLDLARFMFPYGLLPRRWRSTLFEHNTGNPTQTVCSTMMAEAFQSVKFPILPLVSKDTGHGISLSERNPKLYTPRDFDYSPYFEIIKYPLLGFDELAAYRRLPWVNTQANTDTEQHSVSEPIKTPEPASPKSANDHAEGQPAATVNID